MKKEYSDGISDLFLDKTIVNRIKSKLPKLFHIAELESSRAGKIGMEVGSVREKVIIALLIHRYGKENVNTNIPITEAETDVVIKGIPYSIKTITGNGGVKAVWTVDATSASNFIDNYKPKCSILLVQINWGYVRGGFSLIPLEVQNKVFNKIGKEKYLKLPKAGTNPRGVEFTKEAMGMMLADNQTLKIGIDWKKEILEYDTYKKWVEYWNED
ncbi:MAG: type II restriction endonuclease subunit R [Candidatus Buchananbacteria bacterium RIFCSPHIGHO2_02_FULL_40_13]|nr:MAG: type II restriction endonuclease subunit R [Candidatus Buchananbacteria bacterium RIFCSPHIGHO2_02_FULL_40_13]